jgi:hypothetical protein
MIDRDINHCPRCHMMIGKSVPGKWEALGLVYCWRCNLQVYTSDGDVITRVAWGIHEGAINWIPSIKECFVMVSGIRIALPYIPFDLPMKDIREMIEKYMVLL